MEKLTKLRYKLAIVQEVEFFKQFSFRQSLLCVTGRKFDVKYYFLLFPISMQADRGMSAFFRQEGKVLPEIYETNSESLDYQQAKNIMCNKAIIFHARFS